MHDSYMAGIWLGISLLGGKTPSFSWTMFGSECVKVYFSKFSNSSHVSEICAMPKRLEVYWSYHFGGELCNDYTLKWCCDLLLELTGIWSNSSPNWLNTRMWTRWRLETSPSSSDRTCCGLTTKGETDKDLSGCKYLNQRKKSVNILQFFYT